MDDLLAPWYERAIAAVPKGERFDIHTHIGFNDPDGNRCAPEELIAELETAGMRAAVFPMHEPSGYSAANDWVIEEAGKTDGRLVPFCRLNPHDHPTKELERCIAAGARGVKLHPRAEGFAIADESLDGVFALADEHRLPVLIHAGRGIPALGPHTLQRTERHPGAKLILAHAGISDLAWIWRDAPSHPNLFFDTAWWTPADLIALFIHVPPGQILMASDMPYGPPMATAVLSLRCMQHVGLSPDQMASVVGAQAARLCAGEDPVDLGPAPGPPGHYLSSLLERAYIYLMMAARQMLGGDPGVEMLALARLSLDVPRDAPEREVADSVLAILDRHASEAPSRPRRSGFAPGIELVMAAALVARTPDVPLPEL